MKKLFLILCAAALLAACGDDDHESPRGGSTKTARSVMIYMSGENNLTVNNGIRYLHSDLSEIIEGSKQLTDDQRLFVFVDSLNTNVAASGTPVIMEVSGGKAHVVYDYGREVYASDPSVLQKTLTWMTTNAPAESYGLVLWGHASGWAVSTDSIAGSRQTRAYGQDDGKDMTGGSLKWMNITQMARALESVPTLEFIFADCCNMMCAEVAYELRHATNYLIGSPAEIPGDGAPYQKVLPYFYKSGEALYKGIIDTYYDYYLDDYETDYHLRGNSVPLSVVDTRYISNLAEATYSVLDKFEGGYPMYPTSPALKGQVFYLYYYAPVMYDMRSFIKANTSDADFTEWDQAFRQAVPYYRMSMKWMTIYDGLENAFYSFNEDQGQYGCVSMFIPLNNSNYYNYLKFNKTYNNYGWNRTLDWSRYGWTENATYQRQ